MMRLFLKWQMAGVRGNGCEIVGAHPALYLLRHISLFPERNHRAHQAAGSDFVEPIAFAEDRDLVGPGL